MKIDIDKIDLYKTIMSLKELNRQHMHGDNDIRIMIFKGSDIANHYIKFYDIKTDKEVKLAASKQYLVASFDIMSDKHDGDELADIAKQITDELKPLLPKENIKVTEADIKFISGNRMYYLVELDN